MMIFIWANIYFIWINEFNKKNYNMTSCYKEAWFYLLVDKNLSYRY